MIVLTIKAILISLGYLLLSFFVGSTFFTVLHNDYDDDPSFLFCMFIGLFIMSVFVNLLLLKY